MSVTAPPRTPRPRDPVEHGEPEALIEEARQLTRRRRRTYGAVAALLALAAIAAFAILGHRAQSQTPPSVPSARPSLAGGTTSKIAFMRGPADRPCCWSVYLINADGSGERLLMRNAFGHEWSPDGRKIALAGGARKGGARNTNHDIYVMNADGSGLRRLTRNPAHEASPRWSPDGRRIAFARSVGALGDVEIYTVNADGSGLRSLMSDALGYFDWSPDSRKIAFTRWAPDGNGELYVMNADGSGQRRLTYSRAYEHDPAWSPDGRKITFATSLDRGVMPYDKVEVYVVNANGSGLSRVTADAASSPRCPGRPTDERSSSSADPELPRRFT